jgi:hypothetical protein
VAELKTKPTKASVAAFIATVPEAKRADANVLLAIFKRATGEKPALWGTSIIGFGKYHYKSERSTQEGDWFYVGFSPRKAAHSLYLMGGFKAHATLLKKLGKYKISSGCCLYINKLADVDETVLTQLVKDAYTNAKKSLG